MPDYGLWDGATEIGAIGVASEEQLPPAGEGRTWVPLPGPCEAWSLALVEGVVTPVARSLPDHVALDIARAARQAEATDVRNAKQGGGCATPLGRVDTDPDSQRKINGAVTAAVVAQIAGEPFTPIGWTMADNTVVSHDGAALIAMGMAVVAFVNACQQAGTAIRAQIEAAATVDALAAIDISAGYPAS